MTACTRRHFLAGAATLLAAGSISAARATSIFTRDPFSLGVASGDPAPDSVVLWTRLAPDPLHGGGLSDEPVTVNWEIAEDEALQRPVQTGTALAHPILGHSVHVEVEGLKPDRFYFYRFTAGAAVSPVGRTRTLPALGAPAARWRLAFASCQNYQDGFYPAYRHLAEDAPDLVLHLGDYIYESPRKEGGVRAHESTTEPLTLEQYRNRYALYRTDPDLQQAHAAAPWATAWDDHEVDNDWAGERDEDGTDPHLFLLRRAAAFQAYYEHMPLRATAFPRGPDLQLFRRFTIGQLAEIHLLDTRQYRSDQACPTPREGGGQLLVNCLERERPDRTLLGSAQERWLAEGLANSSARWQVLAQQVMLAQLDQKPGPERGYWSDSWDGYPAARSRLLELVAGRSAVVLSGDIHSFWANDLKRDFEDPRAAVIATEFVGTSISSQGVSYDQFAAFKAENPHIRFFDFLRDIFTRDHLVRWRIKDGIARSEDLPGVRIQGAPFMGVMGVAPSHELLAAIAQREADLAAKGGFVLLPNPEDAVPSDPVMAATALKTLPPREFGGNLDVKQLTPGTTLRLPVFVPGALFSTGDAHFAQGDNECCTAIETGATFTCRFRVIKARALRHRIAEPEFYCAGKVEPVSASQSFFATTGFCRTADGINHEADLTLSARNALLAMIRYLVEERGFTPEQAYALCSVCVDLRISQVVNLPNVLVSAFLPLDIFDE